jgi:hypothetical protein
MRIYIARTFWQKSTKSISSYLINKIIIRLCMKIICLFDRGKYDYIASEVYFGKEFLCKI